MYSRKQKILMVALIAVFIGLLLLSMKLDGYAEYHNGMPIKEIPRVITLPESAKVDNPNLQHFTEDEIEEILNSIDPADYPTLLVAADTGPAPTPEETEDNQLTSLINSLKDLLGIAIGAGAFAFIQFLITRRDNKSNKLGELESEIKSLERGLLRVQLLVLMKDYPDRKEEIVDKVGKKYFVDLQGDWYMSQLFDNYLITKVITRPAWFDEVVHNG